MIKIDTRRVFAALLVTVASIQIGRGQSTIFPHLSHPEAEFSLFNATNRSDEVQFTLRGLGGGLAVAAVNPVRYTVPAGSHLTMTAGEIFGGIDPGLWSEGAWVSVTSGGAIEGVLLDGSSSGPLEMTGARPYLDQLIAVPDRQRPRSVRVVNPNPESTSVAVAVHGGTGVLLGGFVQSLGPGAGVEFPLAPLVGNHRGVVAVRVTSARPVVAEARISTSSSWVHIQGAPATEGASPLRVAAHAPFLGGQASGLLLGNPNPEAVRVTVTLSNAQGGPVLPSLALPSSHPVTIPSNGVVSLNAASITGLPFSPTVDGIIRVDSPDVPMAAVFLISQGDSLTAYPLSAVASPREYYPRRSGEPPESTGLALTNRHSSPAAADVWLLGARAESLARATVQVGARSKRSMLLSSLFDPAVVARAHGLVIDSAAGFDSILAEGVSAPDMAVVRPMPTMWSPGPPAAVPVLSSVEPQTVLPGSIMRFRAENIDDSTRLRFAGFDLPIRQLAPGIAVLGSQVPFVEPGYVDVRLVRSDGFESDPVRVLVGPLAGGPFREVEGRAFYEKVPATMDGLMLGAAYNLPMTNARVEVFNIATGAVFATSVTGPGGRYRVPVPVSEGYGVRVLASTPDGSLAVANNAAGGMVFAVAATLGSTGQPPTLVASDSAGVAGAFNILHVLAAGNAFVRNSGGVAEVPPLVVFWSPSNSRTTVGGTFFDATSRTAYVLGDRSGDSDEFDDAVILHEYAHMLAEHFSRDDSSGGPHARGDVLDPRVAWSEGWANFFSGMARGDRIYVDTFGSGGSEAVVFDLESNLPPGDAGGYWSEFAIHSLLWDLTDGANTEDVDGGLELDVHTLWQAFEAMSQARFVYLPTFLDRLVALVPDDESSIEALARARSIDYEASDDPSVSNPFPRLVDAQAPVTGVVDSKSRNRTNLAQSAHVYGFDVSGGAVSIRLDITGLGPAANPAANDLDLFLLDGSGQVVGRSDRGLNGQSELISTFLPAGRYVVEIRSYYFRAETGTPVFNSGEYRVTFNLP